MTDAREIFDRLTDAMNRHDVSGVANYYSPEVVLAAPEGRFEGREQAVAYLGGFLQAFPDLRVSAWSKVTSGDVVIDEWSFTGTNTGPLELPDGRTIAATGKTVSLRGCDVGTVENDQVISHRLYYDELELLGRLGLLAEPVS
jgi:ketosteroid isomerase-like protein